MRRRITFLITSIQRLMTLTLLTILVYGSVGVSFHVHECTGSGTRDVFFYPELFGGNSGCGCEEDANPSLPVRNASCSPEACCINSYLYLRADFTGFTITYQQPIDVSKDMVTAELGGSELLPFKAEEIFLVKRVKHPPPVLSGRTLITFLHQIKIPTHIS